MKPGVTGESILGYCESVDENVAKIDTLKSQIKAITQDTDELTKITAKEFEVKAKDLKKTYKQYKDMKADGAEDSDFWTLVALLEEALDAEGKAAEEDILPDGE
jgi:hypothetical protein